MFCQPLSNRSLTITRLFTHISAETGIYLLFLLEQTLRDDVVLVTHRFHPMLLHFVVILRFLQLVRQLLDDVFAGRNL